MPRLDAADGPQTRALLAAYLYARRFYARLGPNAAQPLDAEHRARGDRERLRFAKLTADPPLDHTLLSPLDPDDPSAGLVHHGAIVVNPAAALPALLDGAVLRFNTRIASLAEVDADLVIVCAGMGAVSIAGVETPPMEGRLGQIESAPSTGAPNAIADGGYAVEALGRLVFGATFEPAHGEPQVTDAARAENLETLARLRPDLAGSLSPESLASRAAIRATTQDRFPFAGAPPSNEKAPGSKPAPSQSVRLIGGLGARGFLWAPLLAELLASEVFNEPSPLEASVAKTVDPGRFLSRALARSGAARG
jgi:tRNA 5-methylaminomethyl-2-thiouridine biosynthesis bifunctional protein